MDIINNIEPDGIKIFYDIESNNLYFSEKYNEIYEIIKPLIAEIEKYAIMQNVDYNKNVNKLRFKDVHKNIIYTLLDKYKNLFNDNDNKIVFMIYGYWFSNIVCKYFNLYFNEKVEDYRNNVAYAYRKCSRCDNGDYIQLTSRMELYNLINYHSSCRQILNKEYKYFCDDCDAKLQVENIKNTLSINQREAENVYTLKSMPYKEYLETDHWKALRKRKLWEGHLWNPSYFVATVSENTEEQIKNYIKSQKEK